MLTLRGSERLKMTGKTVKVPNYTPEQTAEMLAVYDPSLPETERKAIVDIFAAKFG